MIKKSLLYSISGLIILVSGLAYGEVIDKIEVVVNDEVITQSEIDRVLAPIYERYKALYKSDELMKKLMEARQKVIEQLIEDKLILTEAKKLNIELDERDIDEKVEETQRNFDSKARFEEALKAQHLSIKDLRARYKDQLMARKLIDQKVGSRIMITPVEISNYYNSHMAAYAQPEAIRLSTILIKVKMDPKGSAELAKTILDKIRAGADFAELAKSYSEGPNASEGGPMGYIQRGELLPEIEKAVFSLKKGEVSDIIQTSLGYHIFKMEEKRPSRTLLLSEVKREVEDVIFRDKIKEKIKGWVESLKKNAYIAFK